jgi:hypothetical protein
MKPGWIVILVSPGDGPDYGFRINSIRTLTEAAAEAIAEKFEEDASSPVRVWTFEDTL